MEIVVLETNVKVAVIASRSGVGKVHPAFAERVRDDVGRIYLRPVHRICTCPNSSRGGSAVLRLVAEGFDRVDCRK